jgi:hypothetical protein
MSQEKRTISVLFFFFLVWCSLLSDVCFAKYSGGSGTVDDPYLIGSATDLLALSANKGDYDKHFILTADISLGSSGTFATAVIAPDMTNSNNSFDSIAFSGIFDGAGHKITNLTINTNGAKNDFLGLFGYNDGEIKNLGLENVSVTGGNQSSCLGGLVGWNNNDGNISNCYSTGAVTGGNNSSDIGGLVGYNSFSNISNCYSTGEVIGGDDSECLGGLVGRDYNDGNISNCYAIGTVTGGDTSHNIGGLVGCDYNDGNISNCYSTGAVTGGDNSWGLGGLVGYDNNDGNISNCYSTGAVTGGYNSEVLGGLLGYNSHSNISNCNSTGTITGGDNSLGGLVGWNNNNGNISNCYAIGTVTGGDTSYNISGLVGYNSLSNISNCYSTGAVAGGDISEGIGGLVGWNDNDGNVSNCYAIGEVIGGNTSYYIGGLVGYNSLSNIRSCYFLDINGQDNGYGVPLTDVQMKRKSSFIGWDFVGVTPNGIEGFWSIKEGIDYPKLVSQAIFNAPMPPTGISASDGFYHDHVCVTWSSVPGATSYEVWRSTSNNIGSASKLGDYTSPFNDSSVTPGTIYYYWVNAGNNYGTSEFSSSDSGYALPYFVLISKCVVTAGSTINSDKISISGLMGATANDFNDANNSSDANVVKVTISSEDMVPYVITFPVNGKTWKKDKFSYSGTEDGVKKSFQHNVKTGKFSFTANKVNLSGLSCPLTVQIEIADYNNTVELDESIVNGKKPIPINLLMGIKNSLRVDKIQAKRSTRMPNSDQLIIKGGFAVANTDVNMVIVPFTITLDSQTFTLPVSSFKAGKRKFSCSKINVSEGGTASATFDFNKCIYSLIIKNIDIAAGPGIWDFNMEFDTFSSGTELTLP